MTGGISSQGGPPGDWRAASTMLYCNLHSVTRMLRRVAEGWFRIPVFVNRSRGIFVSKGDVAGQASRDSQSRDRERSKGDRLPFGLSRPQGRPGKDRLSRLPPASRNCANPISRQSIKTGPFPLALRDMSLPRSPPFRHPCETLQGGFVETVVEQFTWVGVNSGNDDYPGRVPVAHSSHVHG